MFMDYFYINAIINSYIAMNKLKSNECFKHMFKNITNVLTKNKKTDSILL